MTSQDNIPALTFEQQMGNVSLITVLWRHYFVNDHEGAFTDCDDPACAPFVQQVRDSYAKGGAA